MFKNALDGDCSGPLGMVQKPSWWDSSGICSTLVVIEGGSGGGSTCHGISSGFFPLTFTFRRFAQAAREAKAASTAPPATAAAAVSTRPSTQRGGELGDFSQVFVIVARTRITTIT